MWKNISDTLKYKDGTTVKLKAGQFFVIRPLRRIQHSTDIRFIISVKMDTQELLARATKRKRQGRCNKCPAFFGMKKSQK